MLAKVLVTGAMGQLGSELRELSGRYPALSFVFTDFQQIDITDSANVQNAVQSMRPQFIVNCAAYTAVDKAQSEPQKAWEINAAAVKNLTDAASQAGAYILHISTDYVFDGNNHAPYRETDSPNPQSIYGATKLQGEQIALAYDKSIVIRTAWLYSRHGSNFVKTIQRLGMERACINIVADQVGTPTYAADLAGAILEIVNTIANDGSRFAGGIFHYSNEGVCSWYDFAVSIVRFCGLSCMVSPIDSADYPTAAQRPAYSVLHKGRIKQCYGIKIRHWQEALLECVKNS
jgi:dTDP-4-dehydrorhamnose reductase